MSLQALLREVDPGWYAPPVGNDAADHDTLSGALLARAQDSALGRRLLARCLLDRDVSHVLAPTIAGDIAGVVARWPRARLQPLLRDLGTLAYAPAIRAEIRREPVRRLKQALAGNYLLALDKNIWNGRVDKRIVTELSHALAHALTAADDDAAALLDLLDRQGRNELYAWALQQDPALAEWIALLHPRAPMGAAHLPEKAVLFLLDHHKSAKAA